MVLQAGALRVSTHDRAVQAAAEDLRRTGYRALEELRDLVRLLHGTTVGETSATRSGTPVEPGSTPRSGVGVPSGTAAAGPAVPDLSALVNESRSVGVPVEFVEHGNPSTVAPIVARTAHRVVQEALTNVRKHAPGASVQVSVRYGPDGVRLSVRNTAPTEPADPALTATGSRAGLAGLRQRIELINGFLDAGPAQAGGFQVEASLPADVTAAIVETKS